MDKIDILSIDAWRYDDGWQWNNWFRVATLSREDFDILADSPRKMFRWFREAGMLGYASKGRVALEDDGYNVVIVDKSTREPLFAIEYGASQ